MDQQVKIRGFRIEPGEIENHLLRHHGVKEAVVLVRRDDNDDKYLCAYVVPGNGDEWEVSDLKDCLSRDLPDYMVPSYIIPLEKIPLTPNGKVDWRSLPKPGVKGPGDEYTVPRNAVEEKLAQLWAEVLGVEQTVIGIDSDFFELGGHSLKATSLMSRIHKEFNSRIPIGVIFAASTIRGLAGHIRDSKKEIFIDIEPAEKKEYYSLSPAQKRLYVLHQMDETGITYNIPAIQELEGPIDKNRLEDVFKRLIRRHESLRTSIQTVNEEPVQKIHQEVKFEIEEYTPVDELDVTRIIKNFIQPFDLSRVPLVRVGIIKTGEERHLLMVDMNHIITDGTSMGLFVNEFMTLYAGKILSPLRLQYKDYSEWQRSQKEEGALETQAEYWQRQFREEIPVLELPVDFVRPGVRSFEGRKLSFEISGEETRRLKQLALEEGTTLYTVLLAVYYIFLSRISNRETMILGTPVAGRSHADLGRIIGMFVNTLGLKNQVDDQKTFKEFLAEVSGKTLEAFENQDYPFEELVEKVPVNRDTGRNPLFDTMFAVQNFGVSKIEIPGLKIQPVYHDARISKFDLTLTAVEKDENLLFTFEYCTRLFKRETVRRFTRYFRKVISNVIDRPGMRISGIEIIDEKEKNRILNEFNQTDAEYPGHKTIHRLFEEQVERTPDNTALHGENGSITCKESSENADRLAGLLIEKGVRPDTIVGIMMDRSVEMVVGILGILKAGGAYLPIDPDSPHERIDHMLKDSGARILLSRLSKLSELNELSADIEVVDFNTIPTQPTQPPIPSSTPRDLAYIIYTVGQG